MSSTVPVRRPARDTALVPEPLLLLAIVGVGVAAVLVLPDAARHLPPSRPDEASYAATCLAVIILISAYLFVLGRRTFAGARAWLASTGAYIAGVAIVKFVLSPSAFERGTASLPSFVISGLAVVPLYLGGLALLRLLTQRKGGAWRPSAKVTVAVVLAGVAVVTRLASAAALGTMSEYLDILTGGRGLIMPALVALASLAVIHAFDHAGPELPAAFSTGVALILIQHALWVVYMMRLFG